ncbi:MAG TPA: DNA-binding protein [Kiloniellaceae bacterium]|nr:DNA-binding protein [Kiloniellaceae bacterium]
MTKLEHKPLALSVREAAALAGVGRTILYEAVGSGALPSLKVGRRRLIRTESLEAWLESLESGTQADAVAATAPRAV